MSAETLNLTTSTSARTAPLSYHQERLWFIDQFEASNVYESSPTYHNIPFILHLMGQIDTDALARSINTIVNRHAALRTRIVSNKGHAVQLVSAQVDLHLEVLDLVAPEGIGYFDHALEQALKKTRLPFDLDRALLVRAVLFQVGHNESLLLLTVHHIIADKWSLGLIAAELREIYYALITGRTPQLPELNWQYTDYAFWQRSISQEMLEPLLLYWKWQLRGKLAVLELPEDHPRPALHTYTPARSTFTIDRNRSQRLKALCAETGSTMDAILLTGFKVLLHRYARQDEIIVGTSEPCRHRSGIEKIVAPIANLLVLRSSLAGNPPFRILIAQITNTVNKARQHKDMPFDKLVQELDPQKDMSRTALFDVLFQYEDDVLRKFNLGETQAHVIETNLGLGKYDLNLLMRASGEEISGIMVYNADIYDNITIEQMMRHYRVILEAMVAALDQLIDDVALLSEAENYQQLVTWNATEAHYPKEKTVHQLFEEQVRQTPDNIALIFEDTRLSYGELDKRANQLAHYLRSQGVKPDTLVAVYLERSIDMVVALLAVLKAGGAYLPIEPALPIARLSFMLSDARVTCVITAKPLMSSVGLEGTSRILLDVDSQYIASQPITGPVNNTTPGNLVYCIYTSGSTGQPKGVLLEHRNVTRLLMNDKLQFNFTEEDVWTLFHSYSFDFSVWEIYGALLYGGKLVIVPQSIVQDPYLFFDLLIREGVTVLNQTPSAFYSLAKVATERRHPPLSLRYLIFGGEALNLIKLKPWRSAYPDAKLINMYGITETTVHVTFKEITDQDIETHASNIGCPIPTTTVYVMDENLKLLPRGVPGELCVGGEGVGRGYLNRDALMREKFVANPYKPEERIYRSGDLARLLKNGEVVYLDRIDHQVKIRGFRIELGEIEARLLEHPEVRVAVVIVRGDSSGDKRLVAYVVGGKSPPAVEALRAHLKAVLPEHMVPSAFVFLDALPLTSNGKVDRKALPMPDVSGQLAHQYVAPRTPTEEILAAIWAEVLGVERVGVYDKFFELGGDSILSIQVVSRARQAGRVITPKELFQHQTVAALAAVAVGGVAVEAERGLVVGEVPLTPIQRWFFEQHLPEPQHFNQVFLLEVGPSLQLIWVHRVVQQLLVHHDALRLRFTQEGGQWRQVNAGLEEVVPFGVVDLSGLVEARQCLALEAVAAAQQASLNLSTGPLLRVVWFQLGPQRPGRLLLVIHHLVVDGVSWRVLLEDFQRAYRQLSQGEAIELPPKTTAFKEWAVRLTEYGESEAVRKELDYWLAVSRRGVAPLPRDYPADPEANTVGSAAHVAVALNGEQTRALLQEVPPVYHTQINDVLLTALVQSVARWTGERVLLLDLEGHGREELFAEVDLSRTVGWFTTLFPVCLKLGAEPPGEALKAVKEQLRGIPKGGIGYGVLRYLHPDPEVRTALRALPPAEMSFNYLGQLDPMLSDTSLLGPAPESSGPPHSPRGRRPHLLEVSGFVVEGQLHLEWTYSTHIHRRATVEHLARGCLEALEALIAHCQSPEAGGFTASDFPEAELSQGELEELITRFTGSEK
jgi:fengycin family lipopeptide synthetase B